MLAATFSAANCSQQAGVIDRRSLRLIEEEPTEVTTPAGLFTGEAEASWPLADPEELSNWQLKDLVVVDRGVGWTTLRSRTVDPKMTRSVSLEADLLAAVEMKINGQIGAGVRMFWAAAGEPFTKERSVVAELDEAAQTAVFQVGENDLWKGHVARLRIDPSTILNADVSVGTIRLLRRRTVATKRDATLVTKLDFGGDARDALVLTGESVFRRTVAVSPGGVLRFAVACLRAHDGQARYAVLLIDPEGGETLLREESLDLAGAGGSPVWKAREVGLDGVTEGRYTIAFKLVGASTGAGDAVAVANPEVLSPTPTKPMPNVLLVSIDTLRAVNMSLYGYERPTTPNLESWAEADAVVFENTIVSSPWTKPSHASIFTGRETLNLDVNFEERVPPEYELVSEAFRAAGYRTIAVTGGGYLRPEWGFAQGFDEFRYWPEAGEDGELAWGLRTLRRGLKRAAETRLPFFAFFHTYEVHVPYRRRSPYFERFVVSAGGSTTRWLGDFTTRPEPFDRRHPKYRARRFLVERARKGEPPLPVFREDVSDVVAAYDSGIRFVDEALAGLFAHLRSAGLYDDTIIIVTADHGEDFGEHGTFGHTSLYDTLLRVPLIIRAPGRMAAGTRVDSQVRSIDITPTILDLVGLPVPPATDGRSLAGLLESPQRVDHREAWSYAGSTNYGVSLRLENRVKAVFPYTVWRYDAGFEPEFYDLGADADEQTNVAARSPEAEALVKKMGGRLERRRTGIVVTLANDREAPYRVTLRGKDAGLYRAKSSSLPYDCVDWVAGKGLVIEVRPDSAIELLLDGYAGGDIRCEVAGPHLGSEPFVLTWSRSRLLEGIGVRWSGAQWKRWGGDGDGSRTAVTARLASAAAEGTSPSVADAHRRQLEALGYIE